MTLKFATFDKFSILKRINTEYLTKFSIGLVI